MSLVVEPGNQFETTISIRNVAAITPSNTVDLPNPTKAIYVSATSTLVVDTIGGQTVTISSLAGGIWHPIQVTRVYVTGTSASGLLGSW
jgi:hypothetical protein